MQVTYKQMNDPAFFASLEALLAAKIDDHVALIAVVRAAKKIKREAEVVAAAWTAILRKYFAKEEAGRFTEFRMELKDEFEKVEKEFHATVFDMALTKISWEEVQKIKGLAPRDIINLEGIVEIIEG